MGIKKAGLTSYVPQILPCPFCGETDEIYLENYVCGTGSSYPEGVGERWRIVCTSCMAQIDRGYDQSPGVLCELWNKRT